MLWALVAFGATSCFYTGAFAQPAVCQTDDQCQSGFYCDQDFGFVCRQCQNCEQLKREPPMKPTSCIKSVTECGSCITGLVVDSSGDVNMECVLPDARNDDASIPTYVWVSITIGLLLFALVVVIVVYLLRNTSTFKILASTRASVQSPCGTGTGAVSSAPELPPPYHAHYSAVRPSSPPPDAPSPQPPHADTQYHGEESSWPFIKRSPSEHGERNGGARESAGSQAARVYSNPNYVRGPYLPPTYDGERAMDLSANTDATGLPATNDDVHDSFGHDYDTTESTWSPSANGNDSGHVTSGAGSDLSSQLNAARSSALIRAPHTQPPCSWQDTNNNRNAGGSLGTGESSGVGSSNGGPSFVINVVQTINTVQQAQPNEPIY